MQLPRKNSTIGKLIAAFPKEKNISKATLSDLMISVGYHAGRIDATLKYLQNKNYLKRAGSHYGLTEGVLKNFRPKEEPQTAVRPFKPLSQAYIDSMRRAMRLDDGHEPMRFLPVATRPDSLV